MNPTPWHLAGYIFTAIITPILAAAGQIIAQISGPALIVAMAGAVLWVGICGWDMMVGRKSGNDFARDVVVTGLCLTCIQTAAYNQWIVALFLTAIPAWIAQLFGTGTTPVAAIDQLLGDCAQIGSDAWEAMPGYSIKGIVVGLSVLAFWLFALRLALRVFMVIVQASVTNALAVCVGPVFMAAAAFHQTRRYAYGWLSIIASALVTQLLASAALTLVTGALHEIFRNILAAAKAHAFAPIVTGGVDDLGDIMNMIAGLMIAAAVIFVCGHIFEHIPQMGQSIAGGIRHHAPAADTVANAPAALASAAAGAIAATSFGQAAAASGVGRAASAVNSVANRLRSAGSAGRSLSRS